MLLERTIAQLDLGEMPAEQAKALGHLGYIQWLGALPGHANYRAEAHKACHMAQPFVRTSPAVGVFCQLLRASTTGSPNALDLKLPIQKRRGGARARRRLD